MPIVAVITDFGSTDWYVAAMKGVILEICPKASIVDITHEIPPGDIQAAAFVLTASRSAFPGGTVFLTVVDPGVGSDRLPLAGQCGNHRYVAPDNGVLSFVLENESSGSSSLRSITNHRLMRPAPSATFHGRDIFAPAAAHCARGVSLSSFGPRCSNPITIAWPPVMQTQSALEGAVVHIDHFGNAITNIEEPMMRQYLEMHTGIEPRISVPSHKHPIPLQSYYQQVQPMQPLALTGSSGFLEISVNGGNAAEQLGIERGSSVSVKFGR